MRNFENEYEAISSLSLRDKFLAATEMWFLCEDLLEENKRLQKKNDEMEDQLHNKFHSDSFIKGCTRCHKENPKRYNELFRDRE